MPLATVYSIPHNNNSLQWNALYVYLLVDITFFLFFLKIFYIILVFCFHFFSSRLKVSANWIVRGIVHVYWCSVLSRRERGKVYS